MNKQFIDFKKRVLYFHGKFRFLIVNKNFINKKSKEMSRQIIKLYF